MVVLTDVTTSSDEFELGTVTARFHDLEAELDRVVPLEEDLIPYLWVRGNGEIDRLQHAIEALEAIDRCHRLERVGSRTLFRLNWAPRNDGLLVQFIENDATIVEGRGGDPWRFKLRFPDRQALTEFYESCQSAGLDLEIERVDSLRKAFERDPPEELTENQVEILDMALRQGYYEVPREATLGDLADVLGISKQAASERMRRGVRTALEQVL